VHEPIEEQIHVHLVQPQNKFFHFMVLLVTVPTEQQIKINVHLAQQKNKAIRSTVLLANEPIESDRENIVLQQDHINASNTCPQAEQ
jgi:hypothetical protein